MIVSGASDPGAFRRAVRLFREVDGGEQFLGAEGTVSFVAIDDGDIVGWCWGQHMVRPDETSMLYLHELEVAAAHRHRGWGEALVEAFLEEGKALGAMKAFLTTGEQNAPARSLYERLGFEPAGQGPTVNYWIQLTAVAGGD